MGLWKKIFGKEAAKAPETIPQPRQFPQIATSKQANEWLVNAVLHNDLPLVEWALKATGSANLCVDRGGYWDNGRYYPKNVPLLHDAVAQANLPLVQLLLQHGAAIDSRYQEKTPLMHAVLGGETFIVRALLDANANFELLCDRVSTLAMARQKQYADIIKMIEDEPRRRKEAIETAHRERAEAEARRLADIERQKAMEKEEREDPRPETKDIIKVMKPLALKSAGQKNSVS